MQDRSSSQLRVELRAAALMETESDNLLLLKRGFLKLDLVTV